MVDVDRVLIVFNPHSTGDAPRLAQELADQLAERAPELAVELVPTEHAGHAREIARDAAHEGTPLLVSVSGDGGYNEVVDGVASVAGATAVCTVVPAGNANDHDRAVNERPALERIVDRTERRLDLLRMTTTHDGGQQVRHAHSYVGAGLTPVVAAELEQGGKGSLRELVTTVRSFWDFTPLPLEIDGRPVPVANLLLANVDQMAKVATLAEDGAPDDGRFEVVLRVHRSRWRTLATAVRAATRGLGREPSVRHYAFTVLEAMPLQLDGEVVELEAGTAVEVVLVRGALRTLV